LLTPAEADRRNGLRDRLFGDLVVREGSLLPNVRGLEYRGEIIGVAGNNKVSRLTINAQVVRGYFDFVEDDPFAHVLLKQPLKQLDNLGTFGAWLVTGQIMPSIQRF
jgi:hypothetical protein